MKKIAFISLIVMVLAGCKNNREFNVEGDISNTSGETVYLEASTLSGTNVLDSAKVNSKGQFDFSHETAKHPEFYRLRVKDEVINFSIDSTETVTFKGDLKGLSNNYTVDGSENSRKLKEITLAQKELQKTVNQLLKDRKDNKISQKDFEEKVFNEVDAYKTQMKKKYIFADPTSTPAYFALFQRLDNYMIFDPFSSKEDIKCFAAVATSYNTFYPNSERSKNLYNIAIKGLKNTRKAKQQTDIPASKVKQTGIIDIALRDPKGVEKKLTDLKGKVVLLDFTVYQSAMSVEHNLALRELYNKYSKQGLEIYQISLDANEHFWRTATDNLPWICVRDPKGIYSTNASVYRVKKVPTFFLINRKNEIAKRDNEIKNLENNIKRLLK